MYTTYSSAQIEAQKKCAARGKARGIKLNQFILNFKVVFR